MGLFLAIVLLGLGAVGCEQEPSAEEYFARASELHGSGELQAAVIELKNALRRDDGFLSARKLLGLTYLTLGDGKSAEKELKWTLEHQEADPEAKSAYFESLLLQAKYEQTLSELDGVDLSSAPFSLLVSQGEAQLRLGRFEDARSTFEHAVERAPRSARGYLGLALVSSAEGQPETARELMDTALELGPEEGLIWVESGELQIEAGELEAAQKSFERALEINANLLAAKLGLARALMGQSQFESAKEILDPVLKSHPADVGVQYLSAVVSYELGDEKGAATRAWQALKLYDSHAPSMFLLSWISMHAGELEQAQSLLTRYVALAPRDPRGRKLLAAVYLQLEEPLEAIDTLIPLLPGSRDPSLFAQMGNAYLMARQYDQGLNMLGEAVRISPESAQIRLQFAVAHIAAGGPEEDNLTNLERAHELDPSYTASSVTLTLYHLYRGEFDAAFDAAERLSEESPNMPIGWNLMGAASEGKLDIPRARTFYEQALEVDPDYVQPALNLARIDVLEGNLDSARTRYEQVLKSAPENVEAALNLAGIELKSGDIDGAKRRYRTIIEKHPDNPKALTTLAKILAREGRREEGLHLLETARTNPLALEARILLTDIYLATGRSSDGLEVALEANRLSSGAPETLYRVGRAQRLNGMTDEAIESLKSAIGLGAPVEAHFELASAFADTDNLEEAEIWLRRGLEMDSMHFPSRSALASIAIDTKRYDMARDLIEALKSEYPDLPNVYGLEGDLLTARGDHHGASSAYKEAFSRAQSSELVFKIFAAQKAANDAGAIQTLESWLEKKPDDQNIRLAYAFEQSSLGSIDAAIQSYETVLSADPGNFGALNGLARLLVDRDAGRAEKLAAAAYEISGDSVHVQDLYGWSLVQNGNLELGTKLLRKAAEEAPEASSIQLHYIMALLKGGNLDEASEKLTTLLAREDDFPDRDLAQRLLDQLQ